MVQVEQKEAKSANSYLKPEFVKANGVRKLLILEEMQIRESQYEGKEPEKKLTGKVQCQIEGLPEKTWSMNWTSANALIKLFGKETKDWKNKLVQILVMPVSGHESILVDEMGTKELNNISEIYCGCMGSQIDQKTSVCQVCKKINKVHADKRLKGVLV